MSDDAPLNNTAIFFRAASSSCPPATAASSAESRARGSADIEAQPFRRERCLQVNVGQLRNRCSAERYVLQYKMELPEANFTALVLERSVDEHPRVSG